MPSHEPAARSVFLTATLAEGGLGLLALGIGWLRGVSPLDFVAWNWQAVAWSTAATAPMVLMLLLLVHFPVGPLRDLKSLADRLVREVFEECGWLQLAIIALAAGFGEELLFRGVVQHALAQRFDPTVALLLASLVFGLAHPLSTTYVVLAGLIGLYLGWLWLATDNLLVPILAHSAYDFIALIYLRFLADDGLADDLPNDVGE